MGGLFRREGTKMPGRISLLGRAVCAAVVCVSLVSAALAVDIETVSVGNPGNPGELSGEGAGGYGPDRICGAVDYEYNMGKYEVTAGQYAEFLNAVAWRADAFALYNPSMAPYANEYSCGIEQSPQWYQLTPDIGGWGYKYTVAEDWANRPVNYVSWGDAARFANWLHNGQQSGLMGPLTTEHGSYALNGAMSDEDLMAVTRSPGATWAIPTEDEWYKAAYHKNDGVTGNYFDYPTTSNSVPSNDLVDPDPGNNATYFVTSPGIYTIGSPYYRTEVGTHENSDSPYGTFDQGGNMFEWNEAVPFESCRSLRGSSFSYGDTSMRASTRNNGIGPSIEQDDVGFRVSEVPEPCSIAILALGAVWTLRRRPNVRG